ncbi:MAG: hypothetical protein N2Z62_14445 [Rhodobacteraceae bacterium]|nr:hypothetical protein [Paracoccaceae bacterium]
MHVVAVLAGVILAAIAVAVAALVRGMAGWAALGLAASTIVAAQVLYLVWIAGMASAEARRRRRAAGAPGRRQGRAAKRPRKIAN